MEEEEEEEEVVVVGVEEVEVDRCRGLRRLKVRRGGGSISTRILHRNRIPLCSMWTAGRGVGMVAVAVAVVVVVAVAVAVVRVVVAVVVVGLGVCLVGR